ncbi:hypothetical protein QFZ81_005764 [Paenibacillus sp. V4I9]|nr:hypothetical protein [Paenibacillus sp. V4I9]
MAQKFIDKTVSQNYTLNNRKQTVDMTFRDDRTARNQLKQS